MSTYIYIYTYNYIFVCIHVHMTYSPEFRACTHTYFGPCQALRLYVRSRTLLFRVLGLCHRVMSTFAVILVIGTDTTIIMSTIIFIAITAFTIVE